MARARFSDATYNILRVKLSNFPISRILDKNFFSNIIKQDFLIKNVKATNYPVARPIGPSPIVRVQQDLPFRVRFRTVTIPGYSPSNVPGIGVQIIEFSNYIL